MVDFAKVSCFKAGGLLMDKPDLALATPLASPADRHAPIYIDNRAILLEADSQGATSQCAAYTMSSVIEVALWKRDRKKTTVDPVVIYTEAKRLDGNDEPGTYLDSVFQAAKNLKLIGEAAVMRSLTTRDDVKFAIREAEVCLLGFNISAGWNEVNKRTGFIGNAGSSLGGHAVAGCWYSDVPGRSDNGVGIGNSWSTSWGVNGFGRLTWEQFDEQFIHGLVVENI
jgi:hypothetical protein